MVGVGHVAAWVGVGGAGLGPGGTDEWLQAGVAHDAGGFDVLYYEFKRPGDATATYVTLGSVAPGKTHTFVVYERAGHRNSWSVLIDGKTASPPVGLPASHGRFQPVATAENWDGGVAGTCNSYDFNFSNLAVRTQWAGAWRLMVTRYRGGSTTVRTARLERRADGVQRIAWTSTPELTSSHARSAVSAGKPRRRARPRHARSPSDKPCWRVRLQSSAACSASSTMNGTICIPSVSRSARRSVTSTPRASQR